MAPPKNNSGFSIVITIITMIVYDKISIKIKRSTSKIKFHKSCGEIFYYDGVFDRAFLY